VIKAELALVAEIGDALQILVDKPLCIAIDFIPIKPFEEILERGTQVKTAPAAVADVENALEFFPNSVFLPERTRFWIKTHPPISP
jgi:hypothetical protein